jgi:hypothetical protein
LKRDEKAYQKMRDPAILPEPHAGITKQFGFVRRRGMRETEKPLDSLYCIQYTNG